MQRFHRPPKHQQCITVIKQCQPVPGAGSESTAVTVNNSVQPVCNVSTLYSQQRPHQLLNYQECRRHASVLENGQCFSRICACQAFYLAYDIV